MKIIIETQIRENYAAHTGFTGEFYWKMKGGNTYITEDVTIEQADDISFWKILEDNVSSFDNYFEEYILESQLVDDVEPNSNFHANWDSPIMLEVTPYSETTSSIDIVEASRTSEISKGSSKIETWVQITGERKDYNLVYISDNGTVKDCNGTIIGHAKTDGSYSYAPNE